MMKERDSRVSQSLIRILTVVPCCMSSFDVVTVRLMKVNTRLYCHLCIAHLTRLFWMDSGTSLHASG